MTNEDVHNAINAWKMAARELGIEVVAPFAFSVDGRIHECLAWVAHFGRQKGIVVVGACPPDFVTDRTLMMDADYEGYQWSALDMRTYSVFNREDFIEALTDWGFTGPENRRPGWL
jgi:hypothetical protein